MYPLIRFATQTLKSRKKTASLLDTHVTSVRCWPWDIDPWMELNNGRTLTLYDLGRVPFFLQAGAIDVMKRNKWRVTVAGVSVRYRRRITAFEKITIVTKFIGWDERFFYVDQSLWKKDGDCANQVLVRSAIVGAGGIVSPDEFAKAYGWQGPKPDLPEWVQKWIEAENARPWPPENSGLAAVL